MVRLFREISVILAMLCFYARLKISWASDSISITDSIRDDQTLVSSGERIELGFFSPGNSNNWYLGMWYKNIPNRTVVWVANREVPLRSRSSGVLRVIPPGRLILVNETNGTVWSTNSSGTTGNPVAQLLNTGNLIVRDANDDQPENYLWQSSDHPTNTFLAGVKLGLGSGYLTSWKSDDDPAPGAYLYYLDQRGYPQVFIKKDGVDQSRVGPWNGIVFSGLPHVRDDRTFAFGIKKNKEGVFYLTEEILDISVISHVYLNTDGRAQRRRWVPQTQSWVSQLSFPRDNCDTYNTCGPHGRCIVGNFPICECLDKFVPQDPKGWTEGDWKTNGCVRRTPLNCRAGDGFIKYSNIKLPDVRKSWYNENMTIEECEPECSRNCTCMAYTTLNISQGGSGCLFWYGNLTDIRVVPTDGQDLYIRMASSELGSNGHRKKLIVSLTTVGTVLLILSVLLCVWTRKKNRTDVTGGRRVETHSNNLEMPLYTLSTLSKATNGFAFQNKLGEGGYGPVYKGTLEDGQEIAVKRLSETSKQGVDEFKNEVIFIATLQHRNLVRLLGCCIQEEEKMLVYEYMSNRSLDTFLFDQEKKTSLDWPKRFNIANGVARGLVYLHQDSRLRIIHRDLKASNILLDNEMNSKISDFGIARKYRENETEDLTSRVVGTYGYLSPEYAVGGRFSIKSDVFSFGVIVLEIVSGKRNSSYSHGDRHLNLLGHAWTLHREGRPLEIADDYLHKLENTGQVLRLIHVGLLCVQQHPDDRPTMTSVVGMLSNESELPLPTHPGFYTDTRASSNASTNPVSSGNDMTITLLGGR